jgi:hypothetical protein
VTGWRIVPIPPRLAAVIKAVDFDHPIHGLLASDHQAQGMAIRLAVGGLTPSASTKRIGEMSLSDWNSSQSHDIRIRRGSFVACG